MFLEQYTDWSRQWSPRSYNGFHEAVALWVLSTIAARRPVLYMGKPYYTPLYIGIVSRSGVYVKTGAAELGVDLIREIGRDDLLVPDVSTPSAFLGNLARQGRGQRGWYSDEFGSLLESMNKPNSPMADWRKILREFDNCPPTYTDETRTHGEVKIERPYLAILANMTPADLRTIACSGSRLWGDGFWARFALVAPGGNDHPGFGQYPDGKLVFPKNLIEALTDWDKRLNDEMECSLGDGVKDGFYEYHDSLTEHIMSMSNEDMDSNYVRFAEKALRIAILLASLENNGRVEIEQWDTGRKIAQRWRGNLHNMFEAVSDQGFIAKENKVIRYVTDHPGSTAREVGQNVGLSSGETRMILESFCKQGEVMSRSNGKRVEYYPNGKCKSVREM